MLGYFLSILIISQIETEINGLKAKFVAFFQGHHQTYFIPRKDITLISETLIVYKSLVYICIFSNGIFT